VNSGIRFRGKFLIALEPAPKWALPAERVVNWRSSWRELKSSDDVARIDVYHERSARA